MQPVLNLIPTSTEQQSLVSERICSLGVFLIPSDLIVFSESRFAPASPIEHPTSSQLRINYSYSPLGRVQSRPDKGGGVAAQILRGKTVESEA